MSVRGSPSADDEPVARQAERLHVVGGRGARRHEAQVVVGVDREDPVRRLVGPERLSSDAVAELLERPGGMPRLDPDRAGARPDRRPSGRRVVHDGQPGAGEGVPGTEPLPRAGDPAPEPGPGAIGDESHGDGRCPSLELPPDVEQVAAGLGAPGAREDDPRAQRAGAAQGEADADDEDARPHDRHATGTAQRHHGSGGCGPDGAWPAGSPRPRIVSAWRAWRSSGGGSRR